MKAITLRHATRELAKRIEKESIQRGTSLNKTVIGQLEEALMHTATQRKAPLYYDLDEFAGSWSPEEADEFDRTLAEHRACDKEPLR